jgi:hypothetical protein
MVELNLEIEILQHSQQDRKTGLLNEESSFQAAKIARNPVFGVGARLLMNFAHKLISLIGI